MDKLSVTMESYLDAVLELSGNGDFVRLKDIADRIGVTKSTANAAMAALTENNLIQHERYGQIRLTESGLQMARSIAEKHKIIRQFFSEILKMSPDRADEDACAIEHVISGLAVESMRALLANQRN